MIGGWADVPGLPAGQPRPQAVLFGRRPDLEHLALSCENTEVELPYVDVVNEILEYVVVNSSIAGYAGHDVPEGVDPAELLASPRHVDEAAYTVLRGACYPLVLPWDQRLAALRAYLTQAGLSLHAALTALGADATAGRTWQDVLGERVGAGPAERDVLCGPTVTPQALYGRRNAAHQRGTRTPLPRTQQQSQRRGHESPADPGGELVGAALVRPEVRSTTFWRQ